MRWRHLVWAVLAFFLFALLCLHVHLGRFTHPVADDLSYALKDAGSGAWEAAAWEYLHWNGRYASNFLVLFGPMRAGFEALPLYRCIPALLVVLNLGAIFFFLRSLVGKGLQAGHTFIAGIIWCALFLHAMPDMGEGLYWYTGSVTYTLAYPVVLFALAILLHERDHGRSARITIASLLLFIATGFNEVIMVLLVVGSASLVVYFVAKRTPLRPIQWLPVVAILAGAILVILAPGNAGRSVHFTGTHRLLPSVGMSLLQTARFSLTWAGCGALITLSVVWWLGRAWLAERVPAMARAYGLPPVLTTLALGAVVFLCAFPAYWSTGILGQHRTVNTACFFFLPLWFLNLSAWLERSTHLRSRWRADMRIIGALLLLFAVDMALSGNSARAIDDLISGRASHFDHQMQQRYGLLENAVQDPDRTAKLPLIQDPPRSLYVLDLRDPEFLVNRDYALWWGLEEVRTLASPQSERAKATN